MVYILFIFDLHACWPDHCSIAVFTIVILLHSSTCSPYGQTLRWITGFHLFLFLSDVVFVFFFLFFFFFLVLCVSLRVILWDRKQSNHTSIGWCVGERVQACAQHLQLILLHTEKHQGVWHMPPDRLRISEWSFWFLYGMRYERAHHASTVFRCWQSTNTFTPKQNDIQNIWSEHNLASIIALCFCDCQHRRRSEDDQQILFILMPCFERNVWMCMYS